MSKKRDFSGLSNKYNRVYQAWWAMHYRCSNPKAKRYPHYGGRGIAVCERWAEFPPFLEWALSAGYEPGKSLDRIDNDRGYEPANCRWADHKTQNRNRQISSSVQFRGALRTYAEIAEMVGLNEAVLRHRIVSGLDVEQAVARPVRAVGRRYEFRGSLRRVSEIASLTGLSASLLHHRLGELGWDVERAVSTPSQRGRARKSA